METATTASADGGSRTDGKEFRYRIHVWLPSALFSGPNWRHDCLTLFNLKSCMIDNVNERGTCFLGNGYIFCSLYKVDAFQLTGNGMGLPALKGHRGTCKLQAARRAAGTEKFKLQNEAGTPC